jgi:hypothetical protein
MTNKLVEKAKRLITNEVIVETLFQYNTIENILLDLYYDAFKAGQETRSESDYDDGHLDGFKDGYAQATEDETS